MPSGAVHPNRKRVSGAELWRSLAAARAVVERRQASALRFSARRIRKMRRLEDTFVGVPPPFFLPEASRNEVRRPGKIESYGSLRLLGRFVFLRGLHNSGAGRVAGTICIFAPAARTIKMLTLGAAGQTEGGEIANTAGHPIALTVGTNHREIGNNSARAKRFAFFRISEISHSENAQRRDLPST